MIIVTMRPENQIEKRFKNSPGDSNVQRLERGKASKGGHKRMARERDRKSGK